MRQANLSLAAKFRGPLLSGPSVPRVFVHGIATARIKSQSHRRPYFANNFCDRVLPLPPKGGILFSVERVEELLTIFGGQRSFLLVSRLNVVATKCSSTLGSRVYLYEGNIFSLSLCHFEFFPAWICGLELVDEGESIFCKMLSFKAREKI